MTNFGLIDIEFEYDYIHWEKNRMYPPNHERANMVTINDSHIRALLRAQSFVKSGISKSMTPELIKNIKHDIELIEQVRNYCRQQIAEPGLPMSPDLESIPYNGEGHGHQD